MRDPFGKVPSERLGRWALAAGGASLLPGAVLLVVLEAGPGFGELAELVLAGSTENAEEVLAGWSADDGARVAFVAGFDFVFGPAWTTALALACFWGARRTRARAWQQTGIALGWLSWVALSLDVPENGAYLLMTIGETASPWPQMSLIAVALRTAILAAGVAYLGAVLIGGRGARAEPAGSS